MSLNAFCVTDEKDLNEIFKLRFKVFCLEWGFEKPENHSSSVITDEFDKHAVHFAVRDDAGRIVGALMLIKNSPAGFPIEKYCELTIDPDDIPRDRLAEISRIVIHRDYRRRAEDKYIYGPDEERRIIGSFDFPQTYHNNQTHFRRADDRFRFRGGRRSGEMSGDRRRRHEVILNLFREVYRESIDSGITHWYTVMTRGIVMLLGRFGITFTEIGDPVDYHGIRTPYMAEVLRIANEMKEKNPALYEEFTQKA
jgi:N-acyl-L-homoserine lactone synthetase